MSRQSELGNRVQGEGGEFSLGFYSTAYRKRYIRDYTIFQLLLFQLDLSS